MEQTIKEPDLVKLLNDNNIKHLDELPHGLSDTLYVTMIKIFIKEAQKDNINICNIIPNIEEYSELAFITVNLDNYNVKIEDHLYKYINETCAFSELIVLPIILYYSSKGQRHANVIIIDNKLKTIEYFEPHGVLFHKYFEIPFLIHNYFKTYFPFMGDYVYVKRILEDGLQKDEPYCAIWCLYVIWLKILNYKQSITTQDIENYLLLRPYKENIKILNYLISYIFHISETLNVPQKFKKSLNRNNLLLMISSNEKDEYESIKQHIENYTKSLYDNMVLNNKENIISDLKTLSIFTNFEDFEKIMNDTLASIN